MTERPIRSVLDRNADLIRAEREFREAAAAELIRALGIEVSHIRGHEAERVVGETVDKVFRAAWKAGFDAARRAALPMRVLEGGDAEIDVQLLGVDLVRKKPMAVMFAKPEPPPGRLLHPDGSVTPERGS